MRVFARYLTAVFLAMTALACSAQEPSYADGKQFKQVREVQAPADKKRILVEEFFWYGCPHCYALDPAISAWAKAKPADVDFVRVPNTLGRPAGVMHAKAFYTAESLNVLDKMHPALFDAIHKENIPLDKEEQIAAVFNRTTGLMPDLFANSFKGFAVDARFRKSEQLSKDYGITSVPVVVVGGKYMTSASMAGSNEGMLKVVNFLVAKVRKERGGR
ncbi:thiol:disulfide interchange protein DsbA/DsbL [Solimonas sp. K1W22B-7]|uniref:thiol:disulfide interchange protein DsbA/DsbL n=1 Tax=Solimonas sp. K1W22B-7 TaxID=2303331 RepID=UPI000E330594|nr:thiol:disulfide interchange protein DsbA/DsbL [Solimonas sp. K1W22B-7]AXQ31418.1 thiol:disulfide interchange protein DsbA/DsbL [Solimonas sp. K1W22B-7]